MVTRETSIADGLDLLGIGPRRADAVAGLAALTGMLEKEAIPAGFLGPSEGPRLLGRHVLEGCALVRWVPPGAKVLDVGSGAGLPGLPIACLHDGPVVLLESQRKRAAFIARVAAALGLEEDRVEVVRQRAEEAARGELRESADVVVARALAQPPVALELCLPFVRVGGRAVIPLGDMFPGRSADDEGELARGRELAQRVGRMLGGEVGWAGMQAVPGGRQQGSVMIVEKVGPTSDRFPRRPGVPAKRPLT